MTSSIPAAITYLVGLAGQSVTGIAGAVVTDGWSAEPAPTMFGIDADTPPFFEPERTQVDVTLAEVGKGSHVDEDYAIPCYIYVGAGGTSEATVRTAAFAIWDSFRVKFVADITLGGALKGGRWAEIRSLNFRGPTTSDEATGGRFCLIRFDVTCSNLS